MSAVGAGRPQWHHFISDRVCCSCRSEHLWTRAGWVLSFHQTFLNKKFVGLDPGAPWYLSDQSPATESSLTNLSRFGGWANLVITILSHVNSFVLFFALLFSKTKVLERIISLVWHFFLSGIKLRTAAGHFPVLRERVRISSHSNQMQFREWDGACTRTT